VKQKSGRPSLISDDLLQKIEGEIRANRRGTTREFRYVIPEVSKTTIHEAVTEKCGYRKLCARWVPKRLTDDHKTQRICSTLKFLTRYAQEGDKFLDSIVTGDRKMELGVFTTLLNRSNNDEMQEEVMTWFKEQAADFCHSGIQKLVPRLLGQSQRLC
jgi:hypothetical protein